MRFRVLIALLAFFYCSYGSGVYIVTDDHGRGRKFDGIGGISGGSATSKLLVNYPEQQRSEILDYLFKPNFGASLHILKVEIGGDSQAAGGTESSHMHEEWDENYQRGYEWWIMTEAKKRNPYIKLYGLPWSFPGWLGPHSPYLAPEKTANYIVNWILGAKKYHDLDIDYIGVWNESPYNITYVETLKKLLVQRGLSSVQTVVADGGWDVSNDVIKDLDFAAAVDIIGVHYPGTYTTNASLQTNKVLWSSEDYSTYNDNVGGGCWARIVNQNYVNGYMTSTISWNLVASYYPGLPLWNRQGLMTAQEPWSGYYSVDSPIWVSAHTSQFTAPGWYYLKHGSGVFKLDNGGSVVTLESPDGADITIVIETMSHDHSVCIRPDLPPYAVKPQTAQFLLSGRMSAIKTLFVWKTKLGFGGSPSTMFEQQEAIAVRNGRLSLELDVDEIVTLTTLPSGHKGVTNPSPPSKPFPLPYEDDFESYAEYSEMNNFAAQFGVYEVRTSSDQAHGKINRQVILNPPIAWGNCYSATGRTLNLGGDSSWVNISVVVDVLIPSVNGTTGAFVAARAGPGGCFVDSNHGVFLTVYPRNQTYVVSLDIVQSKVVASGTCPGSVQLDSWFQLGLVIANNKVSGFYGSSLLFSYQLPADFPGGFVAYGTMSLGYADFDNLLVSPVKLPSSYRRL